MAMTPGPPALVMIPRPPPTGRCAFPRASAQSKSWRTVSTRMMPGPAEKGVIDSSTPAMAPVWEAAARAPASLRPDLAEMMGLIRETARAALMKRRGLVMPSI